MRARWIVAAVLILLGLVWIGQGSGLIRGSSFMTDDVRWALIGAVIVAVGLVVGWSAFRGRSWARPRRSRWPRRDPR
jgi:di/tricarboxylate transporter